MKEILNNIPIAIWSAIIAALIAIVTMVVSSSNQNKRLKIQLKHDSELKTIERKAAMRRDVYLNAAEELVKANAYLGSLAQIDFAETNIGSGLQEFFASAAKLALVAEEETSEASSRLTGAYSGTLLKLVAKAMPISSLKNEVNVLNKLYEETQLEIKRVLAEMTFQNESGAPDTKVFDALNESFDIQRKNAEELVKERDEKWTSANELIKEFAAELMDEMKEITDLQAPVMIGIRKELDIDTDIESYKEMLNRNSKQAKAQLDTFLSKLGDST